MSGQGQLPPGWSEASDEKGRVFYSNHHTRQTTWDRPPPTTEEPPPYTDAPGAAHQAAADNAWIEDVDISAGDEDLLDYCDSADDEGQDFCDIYKAFTAMQFIATIIISVCMVVLMVALFRPKVAGCCSSKALLLAGGLMMAVFALFQLLAIILAVGVEKKLDAFDEFSGYVDDAKLGATFGVAVVGFVLAMVVAGIILTFYHSAGNGPLSAFVHNCMTMDNGGTHRGARGGGGVPPNAIA